MRRRVHRESPAPAPAAAPPATPVPVIVPLRSLGPGDVIQLRAIGDRGVPERLDGAYATVCRVMISHLVVELQADRSRREIRDAEVLALWRKASR